jgi:hypothetical protein
MIVCILRLSQTSNATQMNKPWKNVAFEELGGFANIGEGRVLQLQVCEKELGNYKFVEKTSPNSGLSGW